MPEPRITVEIGFADDGESCAVSIYCNEQGRAQLVHELQKLDESSDHFHLFSEAWGGHGLRVKSYEGQPIAHHLKVLFRPDHWDETYYPHVMEP